MYGAAIGQRWFLSLNCVAPVCHLGRRGCIGYPCTLPALALAPLSAQVGIKRGASIIDGELSAKVKVEDGFWTLEEADTVVLHMTKCNGMEWWKSVVKVPTAPSCGSTSTATAPLISHQVAE